MSQDYQTAYRTATIYSRLFCIYRVYILFTPVMSFGGVVKIVLHKAFRNTQTVLLSQCLWIKSNSVVIKGDIHWQPFWCWSRNTESERTIITKTADAMPPVRIISRHWDQTGSSSMRNVSYYLYYINVQNARKWEMFPPPRISMLINWDWVTYKCVTKLCHH